MGNVTVVNDPGENHAIEDARLQADLVDPPDGSYPFIEFEDMDTTTQALLLHRQIPDLLPWQVKHWLESHNGEDLGYNAALRDLRELVARDAAKVNAIEKSLADTAKTVVEKGLTRRVMLAQDHEVKWALAPGASTRIITCAPDVLAWTVIDLTTGTMVMPGNLVMAIAMEDAQYDPKKDRVYCRVFIK